MHSYVYLYTRITCLSIHFVCFLFLSFVFCLIIFMIVRFHFVQRNASWTFILFNARNIDMNICARTFNSIHSELTFVSIVFHYYFVLTFIFNCWNFNIIIFITMPSHKLYKIKIVFRLYLSHFVNESFFLRIIFLLHLFHIEPMMEHISAKFKYNFSFIFTKYNIHRFNL